MANRPTIAITLGDPNGIGPEVVLKAIAAEGVRSAVSISVVGSEGVLDWWAGRLALSPSLDGIKIVDAADDEFELSVGDISAPAGSLAMKSVEAACEMCTSGEADAMVTAPISKEAIQLAGFSFPGHTEFLAEKTGTSNFSMMLVSGGLRVALQTIHMPIVQVASHIRKPGILASLETIAASLRGDFGIDNPKVAVLGLNPHAGDGGVIGREEIETITPAIIEAASNGILAEGPFPADGFFGRRGDQDFDAVLAMYHDQGLAPFKALAMGAGVNVTCGLPIVRTSPDHGTAFGIAGQGIASAESMKEAILLAAEIATRRAA